MATTLPAFQPIGADIYAPVPTLTARDVQAPGRIQAAEAAIKADIQADEAAILEHTLRMEAHPDRARQENARIGQLQRHEQMLKQRYRWWEWQHWRQQHQAWTRSQRLQEWQQWAMQSPQRWRVWNSLPWRRWRSNTSAAIPHPPM